MNAAATAIKNATTKAMNVKDSIVPLNPFFWILIVLFIAGFIGFLFMILRAKDSVSNPTNVESVRRERVAYFQTKFVPEFRDKKSLAQAIQEQNVSDRENCLINFQPLTVIHPGFLGPIKDGVYDEKEGTITAIRMGARCFVLPIDYHDKDTMATPFPEANKPCLLYRDEGGVVRSINGGSVAKVAQAIADSAWSDLVTQRNDPFILVLYFVNTPEPGTRKYLNFLSQVAIDLAPLSPYLLGQTPEGVYNRQAKQDMLFFVNTNQLEKKLIVLCNVDTSGFRTSRTDFKHTYLTKEDLDYWVHMRIYTQNSETSLGKTSMPERSIIPRAILEKVSYYVSLPSDNTTKRNAINATKEKFMITLSPSEKNPESGTVTTALDTYGVQCLPLLLVDYSPEVQTLLSKWKFAWKAKPKEIRYVRPEPITVQTQSRRADANGGMITVPS
jgi:hypothetical protein